MSIDPIQEDWSRVTIERPGCKITLETQGAGIESVYDAMEQAVLGSGFSAETVRKWFRDVGNE